MVLARFEKYMYSFSLSRAPFCFEYSYFSSPYRVINVPIPDDNIAKVVNTLPRTGLIVDVRVTFVKREMFISQPTEL